MMNDGEKKEINEEINEPTKEEVETETTVTIETETEIEKEK